MITENTDAWVDNDFIRYSVTNDSQFIPWDYENISRVNDRLFQLDEGTIMLEDFENVSSNSAILSQTVNALEKRLAAFNVQRYIGTNQLVI